MKKIIVAIDGSDAAQHALQTAIEFASKFDATLLVVNVFAPPYIPPEPYAMSNGELEAGVRKYGEDLARNAAALAAQRQVKAECVTVTGSPAEMIADLAITRQADMVVVGSRGMGAVRRAVLGSVSTRLSHICEKPLLIVR